MSVKAHIIMFITTLPITFIYTFFMNYTIFSKQQKRYTMPGGFILSLEHSNTKTKITEHYQLTVKDIIKVVRGTQILPHASQYVPTIAIYIYSTNEFQNSSCKTICESSTGNNANWRIQYLWKASNFEFPHKFPLNFTH